MTEQAAPSHATAGWAGRSTALGGNSGATATNGPVVHGGFSLNNGGHNLGRVGIGFTF